MRLAAHVGSHPDQDLLGCLLAGAGAGQPLQAVELVGVVHHDQAHTHPKRRRELGFGLSIAVHHDPLCRVARVQRQVQLPGGGDIAPQALLREEGEHRGAGKRLRGEHDVEVIVALPGAQERLGAGTHVILGDHVGGRPELLRELDRVAAAHLHPPALVQPAAERKYVRKTRPRGHPLIITR